MNVLICLSAIWIGVVLAGSFLGPHIILYRSIKERSPGLTFQEVVNEMADVMDRWV